MKKTLAFIVLFSLPAIFSYAQKDTSAKMEQFVSFQVNGLIHEIINTNGTASTANLNPYLLNYSINNKKTGWGIRVGVGYYYTNSGNATINANSSTNSSTVNMRIGVEKLKKLSKRFTAAIGIDAVYRYSYSNVSMSSYSNWVTPIDSSIQTTKNVANTYGGGVMGWLRYRVSKSIFIGTEASFYYTSGNNAQTIGYYTNNTNSIFYYNPENIHKNQPLSSGVFTEPVVVYLLIKF